MLLATLQFSPQLGALAANIARANTLLKPFSAGDFDLLVLPEMAFTGYNHPSLAAITPFLEPTAAGPSSQWARETAIRLRCIVTVGYPELAVPAAAPALCYNSTVTFSPTGHALAHCRKTHLYYTDETWAQESPSGWLTVPLPLGDDDDDNNKNKNTITSFGICMDLNPHRFIAPWDSYELASHALRTRSRLLTLSMAWLTQLQATELTAATEPDPDTFEYWCERLRPLVDAPHHADDNSEKGAAAKTTIAVVANRTGMEPGEARYAGTSWIGELGGGLVRLWGILGRAEERVLVVDTATEPKLELPMTVMGKYRPTDCSGGGGVKG